MKKTPEAIRNDFPIFSQCKRETPFIFLDNAATTHKPQVVIDALVDFYTCINGPVARGLYQLAEQTTQMYEQARSIVAQFIGAQSSEIIITAGTTDGCNMVAHAWGRSNLASNDEILISELEHHSNLLPWLAIAQETGALVRYIPIMSDGSLDLEKLPSLLNKKTKLVVVSQVSNALGVTNDVVAIIQQAHGVGARVLVDAAQSIAHMPVNVAELDADFLVFSGHKLFGPTGVGVLYCKQEVYKEMTPYRYGGGMVYEAFYTQGQWLAAPYRYEAGTPPIAQAVGLSVALQYITRTIDCAWLQEHEASLIRMFIEGVQSMQAITILGPRQQLMQNGHIVSFTVAGYHAHDVAAYLDRYGIAVRAGHHCAQPLARKMGIDASVRVSVHAYTTHEDIKACVDALHRLIRNGL